MSNWNFRPVLESLGERIVPRASATEMNNVPPKPPLVPPAQQAPPLPGSEDPGDMTFADLAKELDNIEFSIEYESDFIKVREDALLVLDGEYALAVNSCINANNMDEFRDALRSLERVDERRNPAINRVNDTLDEIERLKIARERYQEELRRRTPPADPYALPPKSPDVIASSDDGPSLLYLAIGDRVWRDATTSLA